MYVHVHAYIGAHVYVDTDAFVKIYMQRSEDTNLGCYFGGTYPNFVETRSPSLSWSSLSKPGRLATLPLILTHFSLLTARIVICYHTAMFTWIWEL